MQPDMNQILQAMQRMQQNVAKIEEELKETILSAQSGGGAVQVTCSGDMELKSIKIDPDVLDKEDVETLEDLVLIAVNDAIRQCKELTAMKMGTSLGGGHGGLPLPPGIAGF
jgi:DNA-binding protein, YbaB/EbfC family